jgi:micrococcal nuclease
MMTVRCRAVTLLAGALLLTWALTGCTADAAVEPQSEPTLPAELPAAPQQPEPQAPPEPESAPAPDAPRVVRASATRHTDGDTAWFRLETGAEEKVRFIGVDTPEVYGQAEPYGAEASAYTAKAIPIGTTVWLETDLELRDRYDRLLAYIWLDVPGDTSDAEVRTKMLNARLVIDGYAQTATYPPNVRYVDYFTRYQTEAREAGRGLWGLTASDRPQ